MEQNKKGKAEDKRERVTSPTVPSRIDRISRWAMGRVKEEQSSLKLTL